MFCDRPLFLCACVIIRIHIKELSWWLAMFPNRSLHALCINIAVKNNGCLNMLTRRILMFRIYQQICSTILYEYITHTLFKRQEPTRWQPQTLICQSSKSITQRANSLFPPRLVPFVIDTQYVQQLLLLPFCRTHNMHHHAPRLDERKKQTRRRRRRTKKRKTKVPKVSVVNLRMTLFKHRKLYPARPSLSFSPSRI